MIMETKLKWMGSKCPQQLDFTILLSTITVYRDTGKGSSKELNFDKYRIYLNFTQK